MEKYKRQEVSPVEEENERDEIYQASNPQLDSSRTHLNYHVIYPMKSYLEIINGRLSELDLKRKIRSDAILMNSFIITSDGEFFKGLHPWEQREFFRDCAEFFSNKYGEENMISAVVHMDETTPHMHLNFIPVNERRLSKITFTFNYKDGTKTVFLSEVNCTPSGSDIKCLAAPKIRGFFNKKASNFLLLGTHWGQNPPIFTLYN